jgi:hypothetical protein
MNESRREFIGGSLIMVGALGTGLAAAALIRWRKRMQTMPVLRPQRKVLHVPAPSPRIHRLSPENCDFSHPAIAAQPKNHPQPAEASTKSTTPFAHLNESGMPLMAGAMLESAVLLKNPAYL